MTAAQPTLDAAIFAEPEHDHRYIGRCPVSGCKARPVSTTAPHATEHRCPTHGRAYTFDRVAGSYSRSRRCDTRCMFARGPDCECQCAGANHGAGW